LNIYKNGIKSKNNVLNSNVTGDKGDLFIGNLYTGYLDDVIIFNKALTESEVQTLYEMDTCCEN
jgi:Concanavalin A-like lectin/glucanases superfamily